MSLSMMIPFAILLILVIVLIYTRSKFEKDIVELYENKFKEWQKNVSTEKEEKVCKELVGLVYKEGYKLNIEVLNENLNVKDKLEKGKFKISDLKG